MNRLLVLLSQVLELHAKLRPDLFLSGTTKYAKEDLEAMLLDEDKPIFVATLSGEVVGYAMCQIQTQSTNMRHAKALYLDDLCVDERCRHQGIGEALYQKVVEEAKARGCGEITLHAWDGNEGALEFYKKMGLTTRSVCLEQVID